MPVALWLALVGCEPSVPELRADPPVDTAEAPDTAIPAAEPPEDPTFAAHVEPLLSLRCGGCHTGGSTSGGLDLDEGHAAIVDRPSDDVPEMNRVEPGDPDASYLWHKVSGTHLQVGGDGERMPTQFTLKEPELALLEAWILDGAVP